MVNRQNSAWIACKWMFLGALIPGLLAAMGSSPSSGSPPLSSNRRTTVVDVVEGSSPAIVAIEITERDHHEFAPAGSGVLVNARGFVLTNFHVVGGARSVRVRFADGKVGAATLEALSESSDLALLALSERGQDYPYLKLGSSDNLLPGETVVAIGNPYGFQHTVSTGVVSAVRRRLKPPAGGAHGDFIQTDAAINPGNSGGALINLDGNLIGVNSAIFGQGWGLAFAIPIDRIKELLAEYVRREHAMGFGVGIENGSLLVNDVVPDGMAQQAGILVGDQLLYGNGQPLEGMVDLVVCSLGATASNPLRLHVKRGDRELAIEVSGVPLLWTGLGLSGRESAGIDAHTNVPKTSIPVQVSSRGVIVERVRPGGRSANAGIVVGDIVLRVTVHTPTGAHDCRVRSTDDLVVIVERFSDTPLDVIVSRSGQNHTFRLAP